MSTSPGILTDRPCRLCGGHDDCRAIQVRIGQYRSTHYGTKESRCGPCRKKTPHRWRWAPKWVVEQDDKWSQIVPRVPGGTPGFDLPERW